MYKTAKKSHKLLGPPIGKYTQGHLGAAGASCEYVQMLKIDYQRTPPLEEVHESAESLDLENHHLSVGALLPR